MKAAFKKALKRLITYPFICWVACFLIGFGCLSNSDGQGLRGFLNWAQETPGGMDSYMALCCFGAGFAGGMTSFFEILVEFIFNIIRKSPEKTGDNKTKNKEAKE